MTNNRAVRSSQKFKPTNSMSDSKKSKTFTNYKSREKPRYRSGGKSNKHSRDSGKDQTKRRPPSHSKNKANYRSSNRSSNRYEDRNRRPSDRRSSNRRSSERGNIELHTVTCAKCKKETQVPFKPTGFKPVFCRECFQDQKPQDGSRQVRRSPSRSGSRPNYRSSNRSSARTRDRNRRSSERGNIELHTVTCAKCKKETQVPFKPTGFKPVFCRECFQDQKPKAESAQVSKRSYKKDDEVVERFGDRTGPYRTNKRMHLTTCRTCNKEIIIPFKPKASKPVYCPDCFQEIGKKK
ncbi:MAG: CxxC-x17-CxxC domain-containing protein [Candidatus Heimdallarchaeota archaeon]